MDEGAALPDALRRVVRVPLELSDELWAGLLWDTENHRMIITRESKRAADRLFIHLVGGDLSSLKSSPENLQSELAGVLNKENYVLPAPFV